MANNPTYNIRFKCHHGDCRTHNMTSIDVGMADNTPHAVECEHCTSTFYVEHQTAAHGFGWLHQGTHSRVIHYKLSRKPKLKLGLTQFRASLAGA